MKAIADITDSKTNSYTTPCLQNGWHKPGWNRPYCESNYYPLHQQVQQ